MCAPQYSTCAILIVNNMWVRFYQGRDCLCCTCTCTCILPLALDWWYRIVHVHDGSWEDCRVVWLYTVEPKQVKRHGQYCWTIIPGCYIYLHVCTCMHWMLVRLIYVYCVKFSHDSACLLCSCLTNAGVCMECMGVLWDTCSFSSGFGIAWLRKVRSSKLESQGKLHPAQDPIPCMYMYLYMYSHALCMYNVHTHSQSLSYVHVYVVWCDHFGSRTNQNDIEDVCWIVNAGCLHRCRQDS